MTKALYLSRWNACRWHRPECMLSLRIVGSVIAIPQNIN